ERDWPILAARHVDGERGAVVVAVHTARRLRQAWRQPAFAVKGGGDVVRDFGDDELRMVWLLDDLECRLRQTDAAGEPVERRVRAQRLVRGLEPIEQHEWRHAEVN